MVAVKLRHNYPGSFAVVNSAKHVLDSIAVAWAVNGKTEKKLTDISGIGLDFVVNGNLQVENDGLVKKI